MNKYKVFEEFKYQEWLTWIKNTIYSKPCEPSLGFHEPVDSLMASYNFLLETKSDTESFSNALVDILTIIPKDQIYSDELYISIFAVSYVKPINRIGELEFLFFQNSLNDIYYHQTNLNELLANVLISFKNVDINKRLEKFFENGLSTLKNPSFYGLALRNLYINHRSNFFSYLNRFIEILDTNPNSSKYAEVIVFILDEMCLNLKNYYEVLEWWAVNDDKFSLENESFYSAFLNSALQWLNKDNPEIKIYTEANLLRSIFLCSKSSYERVGTNDSNEVIKFIENLGSLYLPPEEILNYCTDHISNVYEENRKAIKQWHINMKKGRFYNDIGYIIHIVEQKATKNLKPDFYKELFKTI